MDKKWWLPNFPPTTFNLALVQNEIRGGNVNDYISMTITGKVDDILRRKCPIKLKNLFKVIQNKRKLVLLEGAPGSGKSTLAIHICQKWGRGELFQMFKFVILVRLRNPEIQQAKCIADLLQPMTKKAKVIEGELLTINCQGVLFILDGWDELPPEFRKGSIFHQLIQSTSDKLHVSESAVIVMSRPTASDNIQKIMHSRVEILGFKRTELIKYFTECLVDNSTGTATVTATDLLKRIDAIPAMASSCHLPLNAGVLVQLYKSKGELPTTQSDIFVRLVCNHISHHIKDTLASLDEIPERISKAFESICELAYQKMMKDSVTFTLPDPNFNTLGLLQCFETFSKTEVHVHQSFIHLSI